MSRPDDYHGAPPGSWRPATTDRAESPTGWSQEPGRPASGPGWAAGVSGPAGGYPPVDGGGTSMPVGGGPPVPVGGGSYQAVGGGGFYPSPEGSGERRIPIDPAKLLGIVIAALGALNFVVGFLPQVTSSRIDESLSVYAVGPGYVPILLLIAGVLALAAFLPGSERYRLAVVAVSLGGAAGALISLGTAGSLELLAAGQVSKGLGAVLLTIFGIVQAVVAIAAYVVGADPRVRSRSRSAGERTSGDQDSPVQHGWMAADPGPAWSPPSPAPSAPPRPGPTPAPESTGSVGYYSGYAPAPGSAPGLGRVSGPSPAMSNWAPPADDDRPTGPQPVIDPGNSNRQSPGERELPRVAPGWPDQPVGSAEPVELTKQSDPSPDTRSRPAATDDRTGPSPTRTPTPTPPPTPGGADDGVTEVYRIPPRTGPDGPAGS